MLSVVAVRASACALMGGLTDNLVTSESSSAATTLGIHCCCALQLRNEFQK